MRHGWHDAYDAQMGTWRWERSSAGQRWLMTAYRLVMEEIGDKPTGLGRIHALLGVMYAREPDKLLSADPIYVSAEMCEVVEVAAESFEPEPLYVTDLPTSIGFVWFEKPFEITDRYGREVRLAAASWTMVVGEQGEQIEDVETSDFGGRDDEEMREWIRERHSASDGLALTLYSTPRDVDWPDGWARPPLAPFHMTPWYFGMTFDGNEVDEAGKYTAAEQWWKIIQTTFRLMQQQLSHRSIERPERHQRRDGVRRGFFERDVVVVRLRREAGERHEPSGETANYSHRFIRTGHWRNQWYPASQVHRQIWIHPTVVGDESLPLVIRPRRAFAWTR